MSSLVYQSGFCNDWATEALAGALPIGRNSPQRCAYGLYAEQLSGTAFTAPRADNRRSWLYRIRPSAAGLQAPELYEQASWSADFGSGPFSPEPMRWSPLAPPNAPTDFIDGIHTWAGNSSPADLSGVGIHLYAATADMHARYFYNADAEMLIVPQQGRLSAFTELGILEVAPCEILVIPRGIRFQMRLPDGHARGYLLENYGAPLRLPELGPMGSNGLANARDFQTPVAAYEDKDGAFELIARFGGALWRSAIDHSPLDVVAWHGTHAPYKYDLRHFNAMGSVSFDHPDPSIFTVLTSPSDTPGVANLDFVIFPPRILAMENTFRPPWFHRNVASEFMGLIQGVYDAKAEGFEPGGASLHNCMTPHGPDAQTFRHASELDTRQPQYLRETLAFMFETRRVIRPTPAALASPLRQRNYLACWDGLQRNFNPQQP
ncbi:homogentisate 1,2-dioxygenase [Pusillimonas sp. CC-YST705]|uniref:Homogentisate 1,2-dioxygenase n=1 Tax=Mesopusillimonas faecipullorum TaxID=2755040 RepID=A0ABS8CBT4_9BURK|nr:homogentisate 1,2-dioxygenase [Mesopusillimonas faecipullorum]MCB5363483.1 homogentisate 1,2-dioxygenase [Mesopusillimonas faecipullorum]